MAINKEAIANLLGKKPSGKKKTKPSDILWFSIPGDACEVTLRFMPPAKGRDFPGMLTADHRDIPNPDKKQKWPLKINSLEEFLGDEDPMEKVLSRYRGKIDVADFEKTYWSNFNVLVKKVVIDGVEVRKDRNEIAYDPDQPRLLRTRGDFNFYWLLERCVDQDIGDITDAEDGFDVKIVRKEAGKKLDRQILPKPKPIGSDEESREKILAAMVDFSKIWRTPDDEYVARSKKVSAVVEGILQKKLDREEAKDNMVENSSERKKEMTGKEEAPWEEDKKEEFKEKVVESSAPNGSPSCFGNPKKLYAGFASEDEAETSDKTEKQEIQYEKCMDCVFESACAEKLGK